MVACPFDVHDACYETALETDTTAGCVSGRNSQFPSGIFSLSDT